MAYSRKVREAARRYWLLGYSDEKLIPLLKRDFPDEPTPTRLATIYDWRKRYGWTADIEIIEEKAREKREEELGAELGKMNERQLGLLYLLDSHLQIILTARLVRDESGKPVDTELNMLDLSQAAATLDKSIKNQRLIRSLPTTQAQINSLINIDPRQLTDEQLERLASGEDPQVVLRELIP